MADRIPKPTVSIIVPTFNRRFYLEICLRGVFRQSFSDYEIIVVDDGSTDDTQLLLQQLANPRLIEIRQENRGEYAATNHGLRAARGKFVTWVHSDDLLPEGSLERRVRTLQENPDIDFCHGDINFVDPFGRVLEHLQAVDWSARHTFEQYLLPAEKREIMFMVHHCTLMFRRDLLDEVGFMDETLRHAGDLDWMLRALKCGRMRRVPEVLYHYRRHEGQHSTKMRRTIDTDAVVRSVIDRYAEDRSVSLEKDDRDR